MAYGKKYTLLAVGKTLSSETVYVVDIYEKDYSGDTYSFPAGPSPIVLTVMASSDDPYDPVLASTLTLTVDITNFTDDLPDFSSTDDRKYWVSAYTQTTNYNIWQGYIINELTTIPFTTGAIFLQIVCVDGLSLLKNIYYPISTTNEDTNLNEDLSTVITNCLNTIAFPNGYNINYCCNIYAQDIEGATMDQGISVFKQTYYAARNWLSTLPAPTSDSSVINNPFKKCYDVLSEICSSFGCQIFQSNGEFWIANLFERGYDSIRYFVTDQDNGTETEVTRWKQFTVNPYSNPTDTPWFFQDNVQQKILRKGYKAFRFVNNVKYAPNLVDNGDMERVSGGIPVNFGYNAIGSGTLTSLGYFTAFKLEPTGGGPTQRVPSLTALSIAKANMGDTMNLSFWIDGQVTPSSTVPKCWLYVYLYKIVSGVLTEYWLDSEKNWQTVETKIDVFGTSSSTYEQVSFDGNAFPINGTLSIFWKCDNFDTLTCTFANVILTFTSPYNYRVISTGTADEIYEKQVEFTMGGACDQFNTSQGASLLGASGLPLTAWFRYGESGTTYDELMRLIAQEYVNVFTKPQINFDSTIRNLLDTRNVSTPLVKQRPHIIGIIDSMVVEDSTTNSLSVDGFHYVPGAITIDLCEDTIQGTYLQNLNEDISVTFKDVIIANT